MGHKNIYLAGLLTVALGISNQAWGQEVFTFNAKEANVTSEVDYIQKKVPLKSNAIPIVSIKRVASVPVLKNTSGLPNSFEPDINIAVERKQAYAVLSFPKYAVINGQVQQWNEIDIAIDEVATDPIRTRSTFVPNSVLSSGKWHKIAINSRGVYKIDYNFLVEAGLTPSTINPQNFRVYGNGGKMMSVQAGTPDNFDDLVENHIFVSTSGTTFGTNDYILFYADGPNVWKKASTQKFEHANNIYEDQSFYFLNFDIGPGKRIGTLNNNSHTAAQTVTEFDNYAVSDVDSFSPSQLGQIWWAKRFNSNNAASLTQSINMSLYEPIGNTLFETKVGHNSPSTGGFSLRANNNVVGSASLSSVGGYSYYDDNEITGTIPAAANMVFQYTYNVNGSGNGFLDYLVLNYKSRLKHNNSLLNFRSIAVSNLGLNQYAEYQIENGNNAQIWDVTNNLAPVHLEGVTTNNTQSFKAEANILREFVAFNANASLRPTHIGTVNNQNLHSLGYADLIIIAYKDFLPEAEKFAAYKRSKFGQSVIVVNVSDIYNEFSSGSQDISGIRNFIKMFYDRANSADEIPKGVLMYGNASYDFKNRISQNTNFVPSYQSEFSHQNPDAYTSDDFFGILDDGESISNPGSLGGPIPMMDIAIGRFPINNVEEGAALLAKYQSYHSKESFGEWKNIVTYVADDRDPNGGMNHLNDCEESNDKILTTYRNLNLYKLYADAYRSQQTSSGTRFPLVNKAINDQISNGTLYLSYSGHGSPERWAEEAILTPSDFSRWNNINKLPFIFTGTCDFSRFDNPATNSAGVQIMKRKEGGAIGLLSTTQIVYSSANTNFSKRVVDQLFERNTTGKYNTVGEAVRLAKNGTNNAFDIKNNFNYTLLADPTMHLAIPTLQVKTDKIVNTTTGQELTTDTLSALGRYKLEGSIWDEQGNEKSDFNGTVYITIFDKPITVETIPSDRNPSPNYKIQNNTLTKISATVTNGKFSAPFIVPKDILFDFGSGKISYYAHTDELEANGYDTALIVGGFDPNAAANDSDAPIVKAYIDHDKFKNGSAVGANPTLYATFFDENGINISGSSLGHDLVAVLDGDEATPFVMNSYYKTALNDFKNGHLYFTMYNLPEGKHQIKVRAWDVYNNSGEGIVEFEVKNPNKGFIEEIYSYPNPFATTTNIVVQHNQEGKTLAFKIRIFEPSGRMVGYTEKSILAENNHTTIPWDGKTLDGRPLQAGLYLYNVEVVTENGISANANQKLVYLPQ